MESVVIAPTVDTPHFDGQRNAPAAGRGKNQRLVTNALTLAAEKSGQALDSADGVILTTFELAAARRQSGLNNKRWNEVLKNFERAGITRPSIDGMKWLPRQ